MISSRTFMWVIWLALFLSGSCFGPRMFAHQSGQPPRSDQVWTVLSFDGRADGRDSSLADAALLGYRYDKQQDLLWFRVSLYGAPNAEGFGVNIMLDTGADDAAKMNWWGANKAFRFDKLVTAWVTRSDNGFQGTIGVGDAAGAQAKQFNNLHQNDLQIRVEGDSIIIGVKRTDLTDKLQLKFVAAVGSNQRWNDDIPNVGSASIDLSTEKPRAGLLEIDVSRNNLELPAGYTTLPDDQPPQITKKGRGKQRLILVPGMYSGARSFDGFIARNQARYRIYLLTPPGLNGTAARSMPAAGSSFSEMTWTRHLEQDILGLIRKQKMRKPVIVAERHPGAQAAIELAVQHPNEIGGVVLVGTDLVRFLPAPKDPTRKIPATFPERVVSIDGGWAAKWFKYVTPETWRSGDLAPALLSVEPSRAQLAWDQLESAPLEIKIRYLCEFWASDVTRSFDKLQVPVLALVPGFDEKFLANPANGFAKSAFLDSWEILVPKHPKLELVKIPDSRMLVLDDQPKLADDAIARFIGQLDHTKQK